MNNKIVTFALNKVVEALPELKEVDTLLTEISKQSGRTQASLEDLGKSAVDSANKYGTALCSYLKSVQEMSKAGFENKQAEQLAELSALAQSAGAMASDLADGYLIASSEAYRYAGNVEKLTALLDGQNQITSLHAVSMEDLANATISAAGQLSQMGIKENELTALLGTGIAASQESGEAVGRAVTEIMTNLQQIKGTGFEEPLKALEELARLYNSLPTGSTARTDILSSFGGKEQENVLSGILSSWDTYEKMLSDYESAEGSALKRAAMTANSWEGLLTQISNSWIGLVQNFADDGFVTDSLQFINALVTGAHSLVEAFGALPTLITAISARLSAKNIGKCV